MKNFFLILFAASAVALPPLPLSRMPKPHNSTMEMRYQHGKKLYVVVHQYSAGKFKFWNHASAKWEEYSAKHWAQYAMPLIEKNTGDYTGNPPPGIVSHSNNAAQRVFLQAGSAPTVNDKLAGASMLNNP